MRATSEPRSAYAGDEEPRILPSIALPQTRLTVRAPARQSVRTRLPGVAKHGNYRSGKHREAIGRGWAWGEEREIMSKRTEESEPLHAGCSSRYCSHAQIRSLRIASLGPASRADINKSALAEVRRQSAATMLQCAVRRKQARVRLAFLRWWSRRKEACGAMLRDWLRWCRDKDLFKQGLRWHTAAKRIQIAWGWYRLRRRVRRVLAVGRGAHVWGTLERRRLESEAAVHVQGLYRFWKLRALAIWYLSHASGAARTVQAITRSFMCRRKWLAVRDARAWAATVVQRWWRGLHGLGPCPRKVRRVGVQLDSDEEPAGAQSLHEPTELSGKLPQQSDFEEVVAFDEDFNRVFISMPRCTHPTSWPKTISCLRTNGNTVDLRLQEAWERRHTLLRLTSLTATKRALAAFMKCLLEEEGLLDTDVQPEDLSEDAAIARAEERRRAAHAFSAKMHRSQEPPAGLLSVPPAAQSKSPPN